MPINAPRHLYDKVVFVEKRGLWPIIQQSRLAEKYDIAFICSEGYAVRACRTLLNALQRDRAVTIACCHDADPAGYVIRKSLQEATAGRRSRSSWSTSA